MFIRTKTYVPRKTNVDLTHVPLFLKGTTFHMGVSENSGTPKSSILIGFSIINHPFWGTPIFGNTHIGNPYIFQPIQFSPRDDFSVRRFFFPGEKKNTKVKPLATSVLDGYNVTGARKIPSLESLESLEGSVGYSKGWLAKFFNEKPGKWWFFFQLLVAMI